jgi:hypothetical protein
MTGAVLSLPCLLLGTRHALKHIAELMPPRDRIELAHEFRVHRPISHAFNDGHGDPGIRHQFNHTVCTLRAFGIICLANDFLVQFVELFR